MPAIVKRLQTSANFTVLQPGSKPTTLEEWALPVNPTQQELWSFTRFQLQLPVTVQEQGQEIQNVNNETQTNYETEAEAEAALKAKGGQLFKKAEIQPIGPGHPWEQLITTTVYERVGTQLRLREGVEQIRSTLPMTVTMIVQLLGSEGVMWSSSIDIPISYAKTAAVSGGYFGTGFAELYSDLVNPLQIISGQPLRLRLAARQPASVKVNIYYPTGIENELGTEVPTFFNLYYDTLPRSDYPLRRGAPSGAIR